MASKNDPPYPFPKHYNLPPFFCVQPVRETRAKQLDLWGDLILSYCRHHSVTELTVSEAVRWPLFHNAAIDRRVDEGHARQLLDHLAAKGNVAWRDGKAKTRCGVYYRTPEQWGRLVHAWAMDTGRANVVLTVRELTKGEEAKGQEFQELDAATLGEALMTLEKAGKAVVFAGSDAASLGVKLVP